MSLLFTMLVPFLMLAVALWGLVRRVDLWGALMDGARDGLNVLLRIVPALIGLMTAVYMLRASGALELAGQALEPVLRAVGIAVVVRIMSALCKDAGQSALAAKIEIVGAVLALAVCLPLFEQVLGLMADWTA